MSEDSSQFDREGIHIERDLADRVAIEEELDANVAGPVLFPPPDRRRLAGFVYVAAALIAVGTIDGGWMVAIGFLALALWHFLSVWPLTVDESEAMRAAGAAVEFPVGHTSAVVRFHRMRSRPRWAVVLYSAAEPPDQRALVVIDAVTGSVAEPAYVEAIASV